VVLQIFVAYSHYVTILKWLTLALFAYFGTAVVVRIPWQRGTRTCLAPFH